jgi:hypothetical protein
MSPSSALGQLLGAPPASELLDEAVIADRVQLDFDLLHLVHSEGPGIAGVVVTIENGEVVAAAIPPVQLERLVEIPDQALDPRDRGSLFLSRQRPSE